MTLVGLKIYPFNSEDKEICFVSLPDLVLSSFGVIKNIYISTQCQQRTCLIYARKYTVKLMVPNKPSWILPPEQVEPLCDKPR